MHNRLRKLRLRRRQPSLNLIRRHKRTKRLLKIQSWPLMQHKQLSLLNLPRLIPQLKKMKMQNIRRNTMLQRPNTMMHIRKLKRLQRMLALRRQPQIPPRKVGRKLRPLKNTMMTNQIKPNQMQLLLPCKPSKRDQSIIRCKESPSILKKSLMIRKPSPISSLLKLALMLQLLRLPLKPPLLKLSLRLPLLRLLLMQPLLRQLLKRRKL